MSRYTVNSCTKEDGRVVWSIKKDGFHNLVADVLDEGDARALAAKLNRLDPEPVPEPVEWSGLAIAGAFGPEE